jgi:LacI family transcriptional regulator
MTKLIDIAKACDVDISTVSRALQNDPRVKLQTKEIILKKADELNYIPNFAARNLARGKTDAIVLMLPSISDKLNVEIAQNSSVNLMKESKDLIIHMHHDDRATFQRILKRITPSYCDGLMILPSLNEIEHDLLVNHLPQNFPVIFVDRWVKDLSYSVVTTDNLFASSVLVEKLCNTGCELIINGFSQSNEVNRERNRGVINAGKKLGVKVITIEQYIDKNIKDKFIGIISTSQSRVLKIAKTIHNDSVETKVNFACFDEWRGEPNPAQKVFVCIQDFESIINTALLELKSMKEENYLPKTNRIKPKDFLEIVKNF